MDEELVECPECLGKVDAEELEVFNGVCETCSSNIAEDHYEQILEQTIQENLKKE